MWLLLFLVILSPILNVIIICILSNQKFLKKDLFLFLLLIGISFIYAFGFLNDFVSNFLESVVIILYFILIRKYKNMKVLVGAIVIFELLDLLNEILVNILQVKFILTNNNFYFLILIFNIITLIIILKLKKQIIRMLTDSNSSIFINLLIYNYFSTVITYYFILKDKHISEVIRVSIFWLFIQALFSIYTYFVITSIQKKLLTNQEQVKQKLELQLAIIKQKVIKQKNKELKNENNQLQEYTNYLDKNEDELRRFKHDYQNMLNGLKISAQEGNTKAVIEQLDEYTNSQFDQKALRKYKGVNHIHDQNLKSIAIAKLTKLYSLNINYSFGCDKDIYQIPKSIDTLDLIRIIGITFDNAIEESQALIKKTGKQDSARVDAMYYQEDGDFEFEIRNRVRNKNFDTDKISQKNYTTKKNHMGLGLSNVQQIAHKYESTMMVNYMVDKGWFTFDLTILPDEKEKSTN